MVQLEQIRQGGFATDFNEHTLGVGLRTPPGQYAIDVAGPVWRMEQAVDAIKVALTTCQRELTEAMRSIA